jgi:hypothetical protein
MICPKLFSYVVNKNITFLQARGIGQTPGYVLPPHVGSGLQSIKTSIEVNTRSIVVG